MKRPEIVKITKIVAHNLTVLREKNNLSVIDLAKKCKVSRQTIYNLESGSHLPTPKLAEAIARVFKVEEHELFQLNTPN